jgi:hypothetical protein
MSLPLLGWATREDLLQAADDLDGAAQLLDRRGWCQGKYWSTGEGFCAHGALFAVTDPDFEDTYDYMIGKFRAYGDRPVTAGAAFYRVHGVQLVNFNDHPGRKSGDVVAKLKETAHQIRLRVTEATA